MTIRNAKDARAIKAKGRKWENDVVDLFRAHGFNAERRRQRGSADAGDIAVHGLPLVVEAKCEKRISLSCYLDELKAECGCTDVGAVFAKRRGKGSHDAYVLTSVETFMELLKAWSGIED